MLICSTLLFKKSIYIISSKGECLVTASAIKNIFKQKSSKKRNKAPAVLLFAWKAFNYIAQLLEVLLKNIFLNLKIL